MTEQVYWEDVDEGSEVPPLVKEPDSLQLVKYAGASLDFYQIHYDKDFAIGNNLPGIIVHGALKGAWLAQLMTNWVGMEGSVKKLKVQYRGMDVPGDKLTCKGTVVKKYTDEGQHLVDCEIWLENGKGERTTPGTSTVALPSRGG